MARYRCTFDTPTSPDDTLDYMARFSNAVRWDPSVRSARMTTDEPVGIGSRFDLVVRSFGRDIPFTYEVTEYERAARVALRADRGSLVSLDTVTVRALPAGGSALTYDAELRPTGAWRLLEPVFAVMFRRMGAAAEAGLRRELGEAST